MAEQFLNRLIKMEENINQLGETLKRMITILGTVTEIKSEIRGAKEEIIKTIGKKPAAAPAPHDHSDELAKMVVEEVGAVRVFVQQSMETLRNEMIDLLQEMISKIQEQQVVTPVATPLASSRARAPPQAYDVEEEVESPGLSSLPADRSLKIADELSTIMNSLKMGCVAGDVLEALGMAKESIMSIVPSDPIMVKIDKWVELVGNYPKRNELQARDVIKLKKDLKEEITRYSL
ncbi:MAG: hypothetical protein OEV85_13845 [Candidatus Thorarchaeota archaeon]|nr:hypothetical protein [Candidatus Thorarchaeota archaeon]